MNRRVRKFLSLLAVIAIGCVGVEAPAQPTKTANPGSGSGSAQKPARDAVFDARLDAEKALQAARQFALRRDRRVLLVFGTEENKRTTDALAQLLSYPSVSSVVAREYVLVKVDIGPKVERAESNRALAERLGVNLASTRELTPEQRKVADAPHAVWAVLDETGQKIRAQQNLVDVANNHQGRVMYDQIKTSEFLDANRIVKQDGAVVFASALEDARKNNTLVLAAFVDGGQAWSERFMDWLEHESLVKALQKHLRIQVLDISRNAGSDQLMIARGGKDVPSLPWFCICDSRGEPRSMSHAQGVKNIGLPTNQDELAYFLQMLQQAGIKLAPDESRLIRESVLGKGQ